MPRRPRYLLPNFPFHAIVRGVNRHPIFLCDSDRRFFLERCRTILNEEGMRCSVWALMDNHAHFLFDQGGSEQLGRFWHRLGTSYARFFNGKYDRVGHLFQNRYKAFPLNTEEYLTTAATYIFLNPVRARMISLSELGMYPWTSYPVIIGERRAQFENPLTVWSWFGRERSDALAKLVASVQTHGDVVGRGMHFCTWEELVLRVSAHFGCSISDLAQSSRAAPLPDARGLVAALARDRLQLPVATIRRRLAMSERGTYAALTRGRTLIRTGLSL